MIEVKFDPSSLSDDELELLSEASESCLGIASPLGSWFHELARAERWRRVAGIQARPSLKIELSHWTSAQLGEGMRAILCIHFGFSSLGDPAAEVAKLTKDLAHLFAAAVSRRLTRFVLN